MMQHKSYSFNGAVNIATALSFPARWRGGALAMRWCALSFFNAHDSNRDRSLCDA